MKNPSDYSSSEYLHRFACWTAARAVQRRFPGANSESIKAAIDDSKLKSKMDEICRQPTMTAAMYDAWHQRMGQELKAHLTQKGMQDVSFGRAAKIIAIYFKTAWLPRLLGTELAWVAHPPIDRQLLKALGKCKLYPRKQEAIKWTSFDEDKYYACVEILRGIVSEQPFWKIEDYWGN
ncbi:MAG: hypothetical protein AAF433_13190 [Bacteroidota bacterium]